MVRYYFLVFRMRFLRLRGRVLSGSVPTSETPRRIFRGAVVCPRGRLCRAGLGALVAVPDSEVPFKTAQIWRFACFAKEHAIDRNARAHLLRYGSTYCASPRPQWLPSLRSEANTIVSHPMSLGVITSLCSDCMCVKCFWIELLVSIRLGMGVPFECHPELPANSQG